MADFKQKLASFAQSLDPKSAETVSTGMVAVGVLDLSRVDSRVFSTAAETARKLTGLEQADPKLADIMLRLNGKTEAIRRAATDQLYQLLSERLLGKAGAMTPELLEAMLERLGMDALILVPGLADSYRRHFASGGKAENFAQFLLQSRNRYALSALQSLIEAEKLGRLLGVSFQKLIRISEHMPVSNPAQREEVFAALKKVRAALGNELFLELIVSKSGARAGNGNLAEFSQRLTDLMSLAKLPDIPAENLSRIFRMADRVAVQGPLGELLSFLNLSKRAAELAKAQGKDVFVLLSPRVSSMRLSTEKAKRGALEGSGRVVEFASDADLRAAEQLTSATAATVERAGQEFTDGIIATLDPKAGIFALAIHECKVDAGGIRAIVEQMVKTQEDIETMAGLGFRTVFKVDANGVMTKLSAAEVTALSGAKLEDGQFFLKEAPALVARLEELGQIRNTRALTAAEEAEELRLRASRKLKNFKGAENLVATGTEQASDAAVKAAGVDLPVKAKLMPYDHEYEAVVDVAVRLLGLLPYRQAI